MLKKHGLAVMQPIISRGNGSIGIRTILIHESGEYMSADVSLPITDEKGRSFAQSAGAVISYLRRYALASMLGIYADEDTDAQDDKEKQPSKKVDKSDGNQSAKDVPKYNWPPYMINALAEKYDIAENNANATLNLFPELKKNTPKDKLLVLIDIYKAKRNVEDLQPKEAAEIAWAEWTT